MSSLWGKSFRLIKRDLEVAMLTEAWEDEQRVSLQAMVKSILERSKEKVHQDDQSVGQTKAKKAHATRRIDRCQQQSDAQTSRTSTTPMRCGTTLATTYSNFSFVLTKPMWTQRIYWAPLIKLSVAKVAMAHLKWFASQPNREIVAHKTLHSWHQFHRRCMFISKGLATRTARKTLKLSH